MNANQENTLIQYNEQFAKCRSLFTKKLYDYEASWRVLRLVSLTDQLYIKVLRVRNIEILEESLIDDSIEEEYIGIVNYGIIGLIQRELQPSSTVDISEDVALNFYDKFAEETRSLMLRKNHDYGEAWRFLRMTSFTDLILTKILRIKQIEELRGKTKVSEGISANYQDIINYALFALIRMSEDCKNKFKVD